MKNILKKSGNLPLKYIEKILKGHDNIEKKEKKTQQDAEAFHDILSSFPSITIFSNIYPTRLVRMNLFVLNFFLVPKTRTSILAPQPLPSNKMRILKTKC